MDTKQLDSGSATAFKALEITDKQIADLRKLFLPHEPHLLTVPTDHPFRETSSYEYRGTPFANYEVRHLQHMTMISESQRGVARAEGDWQARIESGSPTSLAARSSTTTPSHAKEAKVPSKKISIADYKNFKLTGAKPSPLAMEESKQNGASVAKLDHPRDTKTSAPSHSKTSLPPNGHTQTKSANHTPQPAKIPQIREPLKHQLPPRPKSPPRKPYDAKPSEPKKRPIESGDGRQPEKRTKIEPPRDMASKASPTKAPQTQARKGPLKPANKPIPLPDRLSPLPDDLFDMGSGSKNSSPKPSDHDTIVVRAEKSQAKSPLSSASSRASRSPSPLRPLPAMLPLALHPVLDREMDRLSEKKARKDGSHAEHTPEQNAEKTASRNTVGARYEEVRRPDVPGVARKTVTPKVGHPPKRPQGESSKRPPSTKDTLVVKLRYKKRRAKDIQRILGIQAKPSKEFLGLEKQRRARLNPSFDDESEDEVPLSTITSKPPPSKKRPSDSLEVTSEPAPKRAKPEIDVAKAKTALEPPFKSPAPSVPSQKNLLATPKRGDAMKTVAMRRVDSNDGNARTPQTMATSTPASAEKPRPNGERHPVDERLLGEFQKLNDHSLKLKRKMDEILQIKTKGMDSITDGQRKVGFAVALECVAMYMTSFTAKDRASKSRSATSWEGGVKLWSWLDSLVKNMPIYHALSVQLGAILREELGRCYLETLLAGNRDPNFLRVFGENEAKRDQCWKEAHRVQSDLKELHAPEILGPWTATTDAAAYIRSVLELYAKREKTGWKPFTP
ncbi:hypothetical protein BKA61DRAFT_236248 [Leptodontidium sp. MPI-SDFR-AT-0119]|nr:hypothetical protein BKA61DRAFT_236248 [Leptodontidium sp. MPI-SDFR-AT-0119]